MISSLKRPERQWCDALNGRSELVTYPIIQNHLQDCCTGLLRTCEEYADNARQVVQDDVVTLLGTDRWNNETHSDTRAYTYTVVGHGA